MTVTIEQLQAGVIKYIDSYLAPKATGMQKFTLYFLAPSIPNMISAKVQEFKNSGMVSDLFDETGNIKLDEVYKRAQSAMQKSGKLYIEKLNYFADEQDLQAIYNLIKTA